jgi:SecD/SecF fusion protein
MTQDNRIKFIALLVATFAVAYVVAPVPGKPKFLEKARINRGIDLAGGAELRYKVLFESGFTGDRASATQAATDVIRRRVEAKQLKEPKIYSVGDDEIVIQLAGVDQDTLKDYKRLIETAGKLELRKAAPRDLQERYNKDKVVPDGWMVLPNPDPRRGDPDYDAYGSEILVHKEPVIEGRHIQTAAPRQEMMPGGARWVTGFELKAEGAKLFDEAAKILYHQRPQGMIVIMLDGKIKSAPVVKAESFNGRGEISGAKDQRDAQELSIILRSGSLPAPIGSAKEGAGKAESETFVGPTLGEDAIRQGLWASGLTVAAVACFMLVYYRAAGVVAVASLVINLVFLLGIMAFFGATLTLPGIAGIVLTVGMAVDANILIYERMREEQDKGKSAGQAFDAGFDRAWWTIMDANITTLIAGVVLYYFGSGPVQGFAVTLCIGILTTLFSVLVGSRILLKSLLTNGLKQWSMMKALSSPNIDFLKVARTCVIASAIVVAAGTLFFAVRMARGDGVGIDFKGGSRVVFAMSQPQEIEKVRARIKEKKDEKGLVKYDDAEIQTVADPDAKAASANVVRGSSRTFQMRTAFQDVEGLKSDLQELFKNELSHDPFELVPAAAVDPNPRKLDGRPEGRGWYVTLRADKADLAAVRKTLAASGPLKDKLEKSDAGEPLFVLEEVKDAPAGLKKLKFAPTKKVGDDEDQLNRIRDEIKALLGADLSSTPILSSSKVGAQVSHELRNSTFWAMIVSWALMILYVALRFESWRYGVAAVVAIVHDALLALGFTALAGAIVPKSLGLSFDMNLNTLAAILTIIGYSINDTIVTFDRVRENLIAMKKEPFSAVINASVNQTLSRTILTALTVLISAVLLYGFTATTGGGIAEFSFPLIIGVVVGTYSSIYIAAPLVLWWHKGQRPAPQP